MQSIAATSARRSAIAAKLAAGAPSASEEGRGFAAYARHSASAAGRISGRSYIGRWAMAGMSRAATPTLAAGGASELAGELPVLRLQALVGAKESVLRHVGRVAACRRRAAERLGDGADVVRHRAATDAEIAGTERIGLLGELG